MRQGQAYVNGQAIEEPYVQRKDPLHDGFDPEFNWQREYLVRRTDEQRRRYHPTRDTWGPLRVPMDKYFVLGDNRDNSADSRYWGFVDASAVKGRPLVVYFDDGDLEQFLRESVQVPLIPREEEVPLAQRINQQDPEALDKLVRSNL